MDTDSFIVYIKTDIHKDIRENIATRFDTSNYELDRKRKKWKSEKMKNHEKLCWIKSKNL